VRENDPRLRDRRPPGLSIVIVNWNTKELLLQLLGDLVSDVGSARSREIIVVDNDSDDGSLDAARVRFPGVRYLPQEKNLGFAGGVNRGFAAATQPLVLLLNTDVRAAPGAIEALAHYAEHHPEAGIVGPRVTSENGDRQASYWRFPSLTSLFLSATCLSKFVPRSGMLNATGYGGRVFEQPTPVDAVSGCVFLLRRELLDEIGDLDEQYFMYFEETDFCFRARQSGYEVHFAPVASFVHFGGGSTRLAKTRNFLEFRRSSLRYFRKHKGWVAALVARLLLALFLAVRLPYWGLNGLRVGEAGRLARGRVRLYLAGLAFLLFRMDSSRA